MNKKYWLLLLISVVFPMVANGQTVGTTGDIVDKAAWGKKIASDASLAFNNKISSELCTSKPDYYCNGLMVSGFENGDDTYWMHQGKGSSYNLPDGDKKRLALSYFRSDILTKLYGDSGYILFPQNIIDTAKEHGLTSNSFPLNFQCIFPTDAYSDLRSDGGCGQNQSVADSAPCQDLGINSADDWIKKYIVENDIYASFFCGFSLEGSDEENKNVVNASVDIQKYIISNKVTGVPAEYPWNEVIIPGWSEDAPNRVPVMALFYVDNYSVKKLVKYKNAEASEGGVSLAQSQQKSYFSLSEIFIPILRLHYENDNVTIAYYADDQSPDIPDIVKVYPK